MRLSTSVLLVSLALFSPSILSSQGPGGGAGTRVLTVSEATVLTFMREEEKLARDVYLVMYEEWGTPVFSNIAASEQRHMDALLGLLVKYGLPDPASADVGVFTDASLQALYDQLVAEGRQSVLAALEVGVLIEEVDIEDLQAAIAGTAKVDLRRVYSNLLSGSENHLAAFTAHIESLDGNP